MGTAGKRAGRAFSRSQRAALSKAAVAKVVVAGINTVKCPRSTWALMIPDVFSIHLTGMPVRPPTPDTPGTHGI